MKIYRSQKARNSNIYYFSFIALFCFFIGILFHRQGIHRQVINTGSYFLYSYLIIFALQSTLANQENFVYCFSYKKIN